MELIKRVDEIIQQQHEKNMGGEKEGENHQVKKTNH